MTVRELKQKIKDLPDIIDVYIVQTNTEYEYSFVEAVEVKYVTFKDGTLRAVQECLVLTDEI